MAESKEAMMNVESMSKEESSHSSGCLSLHYSPFPFKDHCSASNGSEEGCMSESEGLVLKRRESA